MNSQERLSHIEQRVQKAHHEVMVAVDNLVKSRDPKQIQSLADHKAELDAACKEAHDFMQERINGINDSFIRFMETLYGESAGAFAGRGRSS